MVVGVAKIEADAAPIPRDSAFNPDPELPQSGFPARQVLAIDRECHVGRPGPVVGREGSAAGREGLKRLTPLEQEYERRASRVERRQALRGDQRLSAERAVSRTRRIFGIPSADRGAFMLSSAARPTK